MIDLSEIVTDKTVKPKEKTLQISAALTDGNLSCAELLAFAKTGKDPIKATCIEAIEFATQSNPSLVDAKNFETMISFLSEKAPRIKWESAKVIGNTAHLFPKKLDDAVKGLLINSEHTGTVVRWSAAYALGEIIKLKTSLNNELVPAIKSVIEREEKNSIKKIYFTALKKINLSAIKPKM